MVYFSGIRFADAGLKLVLHYDNNFKRPKAELGKRQMSFVITLILIFSSFLLVGCSSTNKPTLSNEKILSICLDEKKKAITPDAEVNLTRSKKGNRVGVSLSFSSDFIKGTDPDTVYDDCVKRLSN